MNRDPDQGYDYSGVSDAIRTAHQALPRAIRDVHTPNEFAWMSDLDRARLIETETEPDPES